ncbi:hypothetical protein [Pseudorhodobacter sp. MZDSW-24AT]|uniref:hypothetical protein n=1 Tax=Pseudorhodobacter sp. MZDSW-24AT TaxID=2052957 RepID=UPI000C1ED8DC|nr:hypothetical protein [Pseudorhodobacter sp. MZDSW-24AT]PJF09362.1 hypothetical protein CUR21_13125 [Pseudorhodobacter sp. MZDSW-24AT]
MAHGRNGAQDGHGFTLPAPVNRGWHLCAARIALAGPDLMEAQPPLPAEAAARMGAVWMPEVQIARPRFIAIRQVSGVIG